ncbi:MAG: sulfotransferase, partial [Planctomycetota bacterium]
QNLNSEQQAKVQSDLEYLFKALTLRHKKRLIVKSPPHTGRVSALAKWFPNAKFVHISRHPYKVVPSTMRLWKVADDVHAFQQTRYSDQRLFDYVNQCQEVLYRAYFRDKTFLKPNQLIEVSFEELIENPAKTIELVYSQLELGDSRQVIRSVSDYFSQRKDHKLNRHDTSGYSEQIDSHWSDYMRQFGYQGSKPIPV